jgi:hypothetical protein
MATIHVSIFLGAPCHYNRSISYLGFRLVMLART